MKMEGRPWLEAEASGSVQTELGHVRTGKWREKPLTKRGKGRAEDQVTRMAGSHDAQGVGGTLARPRNEYGTEDCRESRASVRFDCY